MINNKKEDEGMTLDEYTKSLDEVPEQTQAAPSPPPPPVEEQGGELPPIPKIKLSPEETAWYAEQFKKKDASSAFQDGATQMATYLASAVTPIVQGVSHVIGAKDVENSTKDFLKDLKTTRNEVKFRSPSAASFGDLAAETALVAPVNALGLAGRAATLGGKLAGAATENAIAGGLLGATDPNNINNQGEYDVSTGLANAGRGALFGAGLGAGVQGVGSAAKGAVSKAFKISPNMADNSQLAKKYGIEGMTLGELGENKILQRTENAVRNVAGVGTPLQAAKESFYASLEGAEGRLQKLVAKGKNGEVKGVTKEVTVALKGAKKAVKQAWDDVEDLSSNSKIMVDTDPLLEHMENLVKEVGGEENLSRQSKLVLNKVRNLRQGSKKDTKPLPPAARGKVRSGSKLDQKMKERSYLGVTTFKQMRAFREILNKEVKSVYNSDALGIEKDYLKELKGIVDNQITRWGEQETNADLVKAFNKANGIYSVYKDVLSNHKLQREIVDGAAVENFSKEMIRASNTANFQKRLSFLSEYNSNLSHELVAARIRAAFKKAKSNTNNQIHPTKLANALKEDSVLRELLEGSPKYQFIQEFSTLMNKASGANAGSISGIGLGFGIGSMGLTLETLFSGLTAWGFAKLASNPQFLLKVKAYNRLPADANPQFKMRVLTPIIRTIKNTGILYERVLNNEAPDRQ
jgi:ribosomal protein L20A (L18A)